MSLAFENITLRTDYGPVDVRVIKTHEGYYRGYCPKYSGEIGGIVQPSFDAMCAEIEARLDTYLDAWVERALMQLMNN